MNIDYRKTALQELNDTPVWDVIIIGGGATGLGCAVDATTRGLKTLLLEQSDFAKGTSSRSTKLVHGGVRYLAAGDISLVYEALRERGLLLQNAPHLVKKQSFIIPCYSFFEQLKYVVGLKMYDWLSGKHSFGSSIILNKEKTLTALKGISKKKLKGGVQYFDGQFDDARLALNIAQTAIENGATVLNYVKVNQLQKTNNLISGVVAEDVETGQLFNLKGKAIINATGVFVDDILKMDKPNAKPLVRPSQGVHLVLARSFMTSESALLIPKTADGRVLFAVPWHQHLVLGTTDTPINEHKLEPIAQEKEIDFILKTASEYLERQPSRKDVLSVFAGLRPLAASYKKSKKTKEISRSHKLVVSESNLITITGGKWTTYRKMAEDTINKAIAVAKLASTKCVTTDLAIHGNTVFTENKYLDIYGSDAARVKNLINESPEFEKKLHPNFPYVAGEVIWSVRNEMARTVEDVLARRVKILFLDAKAAIEIAPKVAEIMTLELGCDKEWKSKQVKSFITLAENYKISSK